MLAAFDRVLAAQPSALLILVPRHPERFERVAALCASYGCVRRTAGGAVGERDKVYLGDTMGELPLMLAAADVAFVGGSLVKVVATTCWSRQRWANLA